RYNKYSRELPQTPWFVEGERKQSTSVQELLSAILNNTIKAQERKQSTSVQELLSAILNNTVKAQDLKFSSSGREDVDVRCLGVGRPFVIEFINPRHTLLTQTQVAVLESYNTAALDKLNELSEVSVEQKTPLRVLHRRPLATRTRIVHTITAVPIDLHYFKLYLTTQAGTYIKEFKHGDLGRTNPNLRQVIGVDLDIVALNVEVWKDVKYLKEGEEEKTKTYCALCLSTQGYNTAALDKLNELSEVSVEQKTPLRVLHRRPLATRTRIVHTITAVPIDLHYFKLYLTTQAGTYIKEFKHGDLGRTNPNLRQVIGVDLDIVALDVENVALDWPPKCSE
ncbi:hypothetical protein Pcinc_005531, partial [Petrolisthes cinctipes]